MSTSKRGTCSICGREDVGLYGEARNCMKCVRAATVGKAKVVPAKKTAKPVDDGKAYFEREPIPIIKESRLVFSVPIQAGTTALELMDVLRALPVGAVLVG